MTHTFNPSTQEAELQELRVSLAASEPHSETQISLTPKSSKHLVTSVRHQ